MRATVYAVRLQTGWQARCTVDWETDEGFWLDPDYRRGVAEGWGPAAADLPRATGAIVKLARALPLGEAEAACGRLQAALKGKREPGKRERGEAEVQAVLLRLCGDAATAASSVAASADVEAGGKNAKRSGLGLGRGERQGRGEMSEQSGASAGNVGEGCELLSSLSGGRSGRGAAGGKLEAMRLRTLMPLMAGRSLLQAEASALLADRAPGIAPGAGLPGLLQLGALLGALRLGAAVAPGAPPRARRLRCRRCGSGEAALRRTACASCGSAACAVCEACLALGRSRACGLLVRGPAPAASPLGATAAAAGPLAADVCGRWGLSPAQRAASEQAVRFLLEAGSGPARAAGRDAFGYWRPADRLRASLNFYARRLARGELSDGDPAKLDTPLGDPLAIQPRSFLLWAVTGAGKTEMIFPLLDAVLSAGGRALLATPRRDVVLELAPRLAKAFPSRSMAVLYGGSGDRWQQADLTLATTHQLMRFGQAFDLVLIDELDAFPYHGDPMLHYAAAAARKPDGATVLLSATPPAAMRRAVSSRRLPCAKVPVRYHRHPLPVPQVLTMAPLKRWGGGGTVDAKKARNLSSRLADRQAAALYARIGASLARGAQVFVFVPYIKQIEALVALFRRQASRWGIPAASIDGTSSQDDERRDKVMAFRERELRLLVTTTILERGVTVPRSDVFILDAHAKLFDEAALVQMAGRAGRSADDPDGRVCFCAAHRTRALAGAIRQVNAMNRLARSGGYLIDLPREGRRIRWGSLLNGVFKPIRRQGGGS
ncbi:helicase-related protein [Cohnella rhizosphaerae]|uniref:Helicase-related protein n=1 Tax=Cohnella rhizosphaerae TaxID=1457232 RepID=A0A9X4QU39_9BACL|nr:helicase-related protein [Cohnella rhizosphaerae]MDG0811856.1 helicase-related protein [Cohnella rhizosphaerae]